MQEKEFIKEIGKLYITCNSGQSFNLEKGQTNTQWWFIIIYLRRAFIQYQTLT